MAKYMWHNSHKEIIVCYLWMRIVYTTIIVKQKHRNKHHFHSVTFRRLNIALELLHVPSMRMKFRVLSPFVCPVEPTWKLPPCSTGRRNNKFHIKTPEATSIKKWQSSLSCYAKRTTSFYYFSIYNGLRIGWGFPTLVPPFFLFAISSITVYFSWSEASDTHVIKK